MVRFLLGSSVITIHASFEKREATSKSWPGRKGYILSRSLWTRRSAPQRSTWSSKWTSQRAEFSKYCHQTRFWSTASCAARHICKTNTNFLYFHESFLSCSGTRLIGRRQFLLTIKSIISTAPMASRATGTICARNPKFFHVVNKADLP